MVLIVHSLNVPLDVHAVNGLNRSATKGGGLDHLLETEHENERIVLGLLSSVENDGARSQRRIAAELGIALGLVNAYLKRCVKKGLVKVQDAPARRYAYYLTPQGFAEKSRLTVQYLSDSFSFFRTAKDDCTRLYKEAASRGFERLVLGGKSDLAEIAILCAVEAGATVVAIVDPKSEGDRFVGVEVVGSYADVKGGFDAIIVTDVARAQASYELALEAADRDRVLVPVLLGLRRQKAAEGA
jgi:predicted transcriptional regulator